MKIKFDIKRLGKDVAEQRNALNISHRKAGKQMKVPHATLHRLEKGKQKDIHVKTLVKICQWLHFSPVRYFNFVIK